MFLCFKMEMKIMFHDVRLLLYNIVFPLTVNNKRYYVIKKTKFL